MLVKQKNSIYFSVELSLWEIYVMYVRTLMTRKSCAVGMRNVILRNHLRLKETNISTKQNRLKNPDRREPDQMAVYKHDRGAELGSTEKTLKRNGLSWA